MVLPDHAVDPRALRAVHAGFVLSEKVVSLGLVGPGLVGRTLLTQLAERAPILREKHGVDLRLRAIATSSKMLLAETAIGPARYTCPTLKSSRWSAITARHEPSYTASSAP